MKALQLDPSNAVAKTNLGVLLLMHGDYENGLQLYENRQLPTLECDKPLWAGEPLEGKTIVVYHEQGFGDTIQFARLLPRLAKRALRVIFVPQPQLLCVMDEMALGVQMMSPEAFVQSAPHFDYHASLASLLLRFDIRANMLPEQFFYLNNNNEKTAKWKSRLQSFEVKTRIGFAWQGNPKHTGDKQRSAPLKAFGALAKVGGIKLICLQKELDKEAFTAFAKETNAVEFGDELHDFSDTLALINSVDVVVSVDTSVAHLAACAKKTVWLLVAAVPDWRWGLDSETTEWYDNVRLFRQQKNESWEDTISRLAPSLRGA